MSPMILPLFHVEESNCNNQSQLAGMDAIFSFDEKEKAKPKGESRSFIIQGAVFDFTVDLNDID